MIKKLFTASACLLWGAVLVASASRAEAYAVTAQANGGYASCSNAYDPYVTEFPHCYTYYVGDRYGVTAMQGQSMIATNYTQQIRFVSTTCNGGTCHTDDGVVYTEVIYGTGRKTVAYQGSVCSGGGQAVYGLGSCAC
jgi:hypothetical protein